MQLMFKVGLFIFKISVVLLLSVKRAFLIQLNDDLTFSGTVSLFQSLSAEHTRQAKTQKEETKSKKKQTPYKRDTVPLRFVDIRKRQRL